MTNNPDFVTENFYGYDKNHFVQINTVRRTGQRGMSTYRETEEPYIQTNRAELRELTRIVEAWEKARQCKLEAQQREWREKNRQRKLTNAAIKAEGEVYLKLEALPWRARLRYLFRGTFL